MPAQNIVTEVLPSQYRTTGHDEPIRGRRGRELLVAAVFVSALGKGDREKLAHRS